MRTAHKMAAPVIERIERQDLHVETSARLAQLIAASEPGAQLPTERELCDMLGVGRSTIREAIRSLAFVGAVEPRQGSGTFVSTGDNDSVEKMIGLGLMVQRSTLGELMEARRLLEVEAARLAAVRHEPAERRALEAVMKRLQKSLGDRMAACENDLEHHVLLARASHNSVLVHFINGMRALVEIWIKRAIYDDSVTRAVIDEHAAVLEAVFRRNADDAAEAMGRHLQLASERLLERLGEQQPASAHIAALFRQE